MYDLDRCGNWLVCGDDPEQFDRAMEAVRAHRRCWMGDKYGCGFISCGDDTGGNVLYAELERAECRGVTLVYMCSE